MIKIAYRSRSGEIVGVFKKWLTKSLADEPGLETTYGLARWRTDGRSEGMAMRRLLGAILLALFALTSGAFAAMDSRRIVTAVDEAARTFNCQAKQGEPSWTYKTTDRTVIRTSGQRVRISHIWHGEISRTSKSARSLRFAITLKETTGLRNG